MNIFIARSGDQSSSWSNRCSPGETAGDQDRCLKDGLINSLGVTSWQDKGHHGVWHNQTNSQNTLRFQFSKERHCLSHFRILTAKHTVMHPTFSHLTNETNVFPSIQSGFEVWCFDMLRRCMWSPRMARLSYHAASTWDRGCFLPLPTQRLV